MFGFSQLPSTSHWVPEQGYNVYSPVPWTPSCPSCPHGYYTIEDYPTFGGVHPQGTPEPNLGAWNDWQNGFDSARSNSGVWMI
eukprot:CAMPEP_0202809318 /NCGR_PEP_ID=MMETSP1389-20130828/1650_1 /ASSEMBLY_ACC=CAM_ASM_000865 /TAXON_ID=302021 /ORGANISM="Rhodomonas sp., Strain CCMP768" /LENGTH=82 /DNA_ID=CAMNT_0049479885 /DNA_START=131 /DNA_END=379 /DNA_ORIENTATION=-